MFQGFHAFLRGFLGYLSAFLGKKRAVSPNQRTWLMAGDI